MATYAPAQAHSSPHSPPYLWESAPYPDFPSLPQDRFISSWCTFEKPRVQGSQPPALHHRRRGMDPDGCIIAFSFVSPALTSPKDRRSSSASSGPRSWKHKNRSVTSKVAHAMRLNHVSEGGNAGMTNNQLCA